MRVSVSIPVALCREADRAARKLRVSRSALIRMALDEFLKRRQEEKITESINRYISKYGSELSAEDEAWLEHGRQVVWRELEGDDWGPDGTEPKKR